jgi:transposase
MTKARNGTRYTTLIKQQARLLRADGMTHREVAKKLGTSVSIAHQWTKEIRISESQKQAIKNRRNRHRMNNAEKKLAGKRLAPYQYKLKYSDAKWSHSTQTRAECTPHIQRQIWKLE